MAQDKVGAVLVVGAGVGGIRAAFDLAESGFKVFLVDKSPGLGGTIPQLDKWFPDNQCEMCKLLPVFSRDECSQFCLRRDIYHPNIEPVPNTVIDKVEGKAGNFSVSVTTGSRLVKLERCTACGLCADVCPVEVPDEFNEGLKNRKAIYVRNPSGVPNIFVIDKENCTRCGKCVEACPTDAIDLELPDESRIIEAGAIIVSSGFDEFDSTEMGQYGFGRYPNVVNNIQLERLLSSNGKTSGKLLRPSDGEAPKNVAILQCVGSRDMKRNYCSAACCMYALKEAVLIKELDPETEVTIFYMDMRAFGKDYHRYYMKAQELGVNFTRCRVSTLRNNPKTNDLTLVARTEDGSLISSEYGLAVLSVAQCPSDGVAELAGVLGVDLNKWGFIENAGYSQVKTSKEGIYICGSAAAPADISDTVLQAGAAAAESSRLLASVRNRAVSKKAEKEVKDGDEESKIGIYLCKCGDIVPSVVDMERVADSAGKLPGVVSVEQVDYLCLPESVDKLKDAVKKSGANRVIIAACAPYRYHRLFDEALQEAGIDPSLWQLVNFREQLAWVHKDSQGLATDKALGMLAVAVQNLRAREPYGLLSVPVNSAGLVIGGGISGLTATLNLAEQGYKVHLVEKSSELGGHVRDMYSSLVGPDPQAYLKEVLEQVKSNKNITAYLESEVVEITGHAGNYTASIKKGEEISTVEHGAVIIATGAREYHPTEYGYGENDRVITQKELQKRLAEGNLEASIVVMIQCVGSRDEEHPYCNRTCCSDAIANALKIKEQNPETEVIILNRDVMTYAFREEYYTKAREAGILFLRYEPEEKPEVTAGEKTVTVIVNDLSVPGKLEIEADLLVLSTGIVSGENSGIAGLLELGLTADGFFREVDTKFRPVDSVIDGVFICGRANAPRNLDEEIIQAQAAAQRAAGILSREKLESGRIVSEVNARRCSACGVCVTVCPFNARWMDDENKVAVVEEAFCQACGACVAACPNSAAKLRGLKDKQVFSMIDAAL